MLIRFDSDKEARNREKHGVSLAFGAEVLADVDRLDVVDVRFDQYRLSEFRAPGAEPESRYNALRIYRFRGL